MKLALVWALAIVAAVAAGTNCGAVTLEPLPPEEPLPEAGPPPRLVRRDAGPNAAPEEPTP